MCISHLPVLNRHNCHGSVSTCVQAIAWTYEYTHIRIGMCMDMCTDTCQCSAGSIAAAAARVSGCAGLANGEQSAIDSAVWHSSHLYRDTWPRRGLDMCVGMCVAEESAMMLQQLCAGPSTNSHHLQTHLHTHVQAQLDISSC